MAVEETGMRLDSLKVTERRLQRALQTRCSPSRWWWASEPDEPTLAKMEYLSIWVPLFEPALTFLIALMAKRGKLAEKEISFH